MPKGCSKRVLGKLRVDLESTGNLQSIRAIRSSKGPLFDEIRAFKVYPHFFHFPGIFGIFLPYLVILSSKQGPNFNNQGVWGSRGIVMRLLHPSVSFRRHTTKNLVKK